MKAFSRNYPPPQNKQTTTHRELQNLLTFHKPISIPLFINSIFECLQPLILHASETSLNLLSCILYSQFAHLHSLHITSDSGRIISDKEGYESGNLGLCDVKTIISSISWGSFKFYLQSCSKLLAHRDFFDKTQIFQNT